MTASISPAEFMKRIAAPPVGGSDPWASRYADELRRIFHEHAARAPRSQQVHLGPSELGVHCDRQVAGKMAQLPRTNHVADPWPSIVGTACHAWAADAFDAQNERLGRERFLTEHRVTPHPLHSGTGDLYDHDEEAVVDHKFLGVTGMAKIRTTGPGRQYTVQLLLYKRGFELMGLPVRRVVLAAYPRTAGTLDGLYVWTREASAADDELLEEVFAQTEIRRQWAIALIAGTAELTDVPSAPSADECYFCPLYRPQSARDAGPGCPGHAAGQQ